SRCVVTVSRTCYSPFAGDAPSPSFNLPHLRKPGAVVVSGGDEGPQCHFAKTTSSPTSGCARDAAPDDALRPVRSETNRRSDPSALRL
ncbi:hypothetical protein MUK42_37451, partial [Musa troglodytarum]